MRVALYPGSFDPLHLGPLDVVEEAVGIFGEVVVGVMVNPDKPASWLPADERAALIRESTAHLGRSVCVECVTGLAVQAARAIGAAAIVKSARTGGDFEVEQQMAQMNRASAGVRTVLVFSKPEHSFISSRYVRQYADLRGPMERELVPAAVARAIAARRPS